MSEQIPPTNKEMYQPLYLKIAGALEEEIKKGKYKEGDLLLTEKVLEKVFGASRSTIRNAISVLEKHGYLLRKRGKGTIVRQTKITQTLNYITSLTETFENKGMTVNTGMLSIRKILPSNEARASLKIDEGTPVYMIQRTRIVDDETIAFVTTYLPSSLVPELENQQEKLKSSGLYHLLEQEYHLVLKNAVETISMYRSGPIERDIFHIQEGMPLFRSERITSLEDGTILELGVSIIRADRYEFTVYLTNRPSSKFP